MRRGRAARAFRRAAVRPHAHSRRYLNETDDALAIVYQAALLLTLVLAFLLKGASFTHTVEAFELFELQVGKALLAFCAAPLVLAVVFAAHDFGATRELKRRVERNPSLSRLALRKSRKPRATTSHGGGRSSDDDEDVKVVDVQDVDAAIAEEMSTTVRRNSGNL